MRLAVPGGAGRTIPRPWRGRVWGSYPRSNRGVSISIRASLSLRETRLVSPGRTQVRDSPHVDEGLLTDLLTYG